MNIIQRIDHLTELKPEQLSETPPAPTSCKIGLTDRCNFKCKYCAHSKIEHARDMDYQLFTEIMVKLRTAGVSQLGLFYLGESLLLPWLGMAIRDAKAAGFTNVFCTTNGSLATAPIVEHLMDAGLNSLKFSLNYDTREQMADVAGVDPNVWEKVNRNIAAAREIRDTMGYKCELSASHIKFNGEQGERMNARIDNLLPYLDNVYQLPLYNQAGEAPGDPGWTPIQGNPGRVGAERHPIPCWVLFAQGHITVDGKLSMCCFDHCRQFIAGDLTTGSFMDAWHSETFKALRRAHLAGDVSNTACRDCITSLS
jgi:MoaA/NifB/PqqE/SkfB family radical SAM enzyme